MWIFEDEETQLQKRIPVLLPQLEDIGALGEIIAKEIHVLKKEFQHYDSKTGGGDLAESSSTPLLKLETIKSEVSIYAEKSTAVIEKLRNILTEVRDNTFCLSIFGAKLSGTKFMAFVFSFISFIIALEISAYTAHICDVTGAFATNTHLTRPFPFYCNVDRGLFEAKPSEVVLYVARQAEISNSASALAIRTSSILALIIVSAMYKRRLDRKFRHSTEGQALLLDEAKDILVKWLMEHGHPSPAFLQSRFLEIEKILDPQESEAGEESDSEDEFSDEDEGKGDETTEPEASPEPSPPRTVKLENEY